MCDCIEKVNGLLAEQNTELMTTMSFGGFPSRPALEAQKIDSKKRGKPARMIASFCPFCGEKYEAAPETRQPAGES